MQIASSESPLRGWLYLKGNGPLIRPICKTSMEAMEMEIEKNYGDDREDFERLTEMTDQEVEDHWKAVLD